MATKNVAANTSRAAAKAAKATPKEVVKSQLGADEQAAAQEARQKSKAEKADRDAAKKAKADAHNKKKAKGGKDEGLDDLLNAGLSSGANKKKAGKK